VIDEGGQSIFGLILATWLPKGAEGLRSQRSSGGDRIIFSGVPENEMVHLDVVGVGGLAAADEGGEGEGGMKG